MIFFFFTELQLILASKVFVAGMDAPQLASDKEQGAAAAAQPKQSLTTYYSDMISNRYRFCLPGEGNFCDASFFTAPAPHVPPAG